MTREDKIIAMQQRKKEFDGKFYIAVKTTGIVCLPSCPAQPLPKNVEFYDSYEDVICDGYRPCKRCKPDIFFMERTKST